MSISLGFDPLTIEVRLAPDSDFAAALIASDGWPAGAQIELRFPLSGSIVVWPAEIDGNTASWDVTADAVAALLGAGAQRVRLLYQDGSGGPALLWATGAVNVR